MTGLPPALDSAVRHRVIVNGRPPASGGNAGTGVDALKKCTCVGRSEGKLRLDAVCMAIA